MDLQKLELLIKKINQAIKTIQKLKEAEIKYQKDISDLKEANTNLHNENISLKEQVENLQKEVHGNNILHKEVENKIVEILKSLPDDEPEISNTNTSMKDMFSEEYLDDKVQKKKEEVESNEVIVAAAESEAESEEEMLKNFVKEQHENEEKGLLFNDSNEFLETKNIFEDDFPPTKTETLSEKNIEKVPEPISENLSEKIKKDFDIKFEDTLLDNNNDEIDFSFENKESRNDSDLPKGVL